METRKGKEGQNARKEKGLIATGTKKKKSLDQAKMSQGRVPGLPRPNPVALSGDIGNMGLAASYLSIPYPGSWACLFPVVVSWSLLLAAATAAAAAAAALPVSF